MATVKGSAVYKKKDGTLTIAKDQKTVIWTPVAPRGAPPGLIINVVDITSWYPQVFMTRGSLLTVARFAAVAGISGKGDAKVLCQII